MTCAQGLLRLLWGGPEVGVLRDWWKLNEYRYPKLAFFAKTVLCIPATSVPCERLFSSAGYIVNKTRSSLEPNTVNMLVYLRSWLSDNI